ncbi:P-loop NTPase [Salinilacihabitans rarus]|uniref:P-loop NTPase n=1 Tax=Salinilacihabitans rarus TaxID=2961596 RepID=UPI0020C8BDD3|nr:P-loop NTPase [Salinilacihabitans rarus]
MTRDAHTPNASGADEPDGDVRERVEAALRRVVDPDVGTNVIEAGLVERIRVDREADAAPAVTVEVALDGFDARDGRSVMDAMLRSVRHEGIERVRVEPAAAPPSEGRTAGVAGFDAVIAVASAKGGVGKSTVATHLACGLAADRSVALFDADVHGPNAPSLLGATGPVRSDDEGHPLAIDAGGLEIMSVGLMEEGAPLAWRGAMVHDAVTELFRETAWEASDVLVIDLPPGTGDVVLTTLDEVPVDGVLFVTTPFHASVADTRRSLALFRENGVSVIGTVRNMAYSECSHCGEREPLFEPTDAGGDDSIDAATVAELPFDRALQRTAEPGVAPDAVEPVVEAVADLLGPAAVPDAAVDIRGLSPGERRERVRTAFESTAPGDPFVLASDRDPSPVRGFLADVAGVDERDGFPRFDVERASLGTWLLRTVRP